MGRYGRTRGLAALVAAVLVIGVACDDDSPSGGSSGGDEDPGADLTGPPVKIMVMGTFEGFGDDYFQIPEAAQAAASAIEADGGVNGSPFEIIECNIASENDASDCGRQAVDENVIATVGTFSTFADQYLPILEDAGIPQVAVYPIGFADYTSAVNYPLFGGALAVTAGMGAQLADTGAEEINVTYLGIEDGALAADLVEVGTEPRGTTIISETPVPEGTVEFSAIAASSTDGDPDGIAMLVTPRDLGGLARSIVQTGYDGLLSTATSSVTPAQLDELSDILDGTLIPSGFKPATLTDDPGVQQFNDEMDEYAPDAVRDDSAQNAWAGVHLLAEVLDGATRMNAQTLTAALDSTGKVDLGLVPPIDFKQGTEIPQLAPGVEIRIYNTTVVYTVVEDGELVAVDGEFVDVLEG
jgi:branched-chain amino acid transport system substrate-binding protein